METNKTITVSKETLLDTYKNADKNTKKAFEYLYGVETFPKNVMERVKTFEDAINELGNEHPLVKTYNLLLENKLDTQKGLLSYHKLCIITEALNEGWEPQFSEDEERYYPCFYFYTQREIDNMSKNERNNVLILEKPIGKYVGLVYVASSHVPARIANVGSRLCFKTRKLAEYAAKQFIELYLDYYMK